MQDIQRTCFSSVSEISGLDHQNQNIIATSDFVVIDHVSPYYVFRDLLQSDVPYRIDDYRFMIFHKADLHITANLTPVHLTDNTIAFIRNGGVVQFPTLPSPETQISGFVLRGEFMRYVLRTCNLSAFEGKLRLFCLHVTAEEVSCLEHVLKAITMLLCRPKPFQNTIESLFAAAITYIISLYEKESNNGIQEKTRAQQVFGQFAELVNEHCIKHHSLSFYADRLCLTERYLGTLVHQASGMTAKEFIDRALTTEAQLTLKHSSLNPTQISDELNFANPSFFSKFFKRMTGMTPLEYRNT